MFVTIREDEDSFLVTLTMGNRELEERGETLSEAFHLLAESLEEGGL